MRDIEKRLRRLERHFAQRTFGFVVRLVCMCGWPREGDEHVCPSEPPPRRPNVIVLGLD